MSRGSSWPGLRLTELSSRYRRRRIASSDRRVDSQPGDRQWTSERAGDAGDGGDGSGTDVINQTRLTPRAVGGCGPAGCSGSDSSALTAPL